MKVSKRTSPLPEAAEEKTVGLKMVERYRPRMSRLTDAERQRLMERGLRIVYSGN